MKNYDQLRFTYHDIMPAHPGKPTGKPNSANPRPMGREIPVKVVTGKDLASKNKKTKGDKISPKEARLVFYSNLASSNGPSVRVQRPLNRRLSGVRSDETNEVPDLIMKSIDFELPKENTNTSSKKGAVLAWLNDKVAYIKPFLSSVKEMASKLKQRLGLTNILTKKRLTLPGKYSKSTYILILLFIVLFSSLIYGANLLVDNSRQRALSESRAQAEWEQSKKEWDYALARFEAKENNRAIDNNKEKSCANIN